MTRRSINLNNKVDRIMEWVFPTVLIALVPVAARLLMVSAHRGYPIQSWLDLAENASPNGELVFISATLVAESIGDIWRRQIPKHQKNVIASMCLIFALASTFVFAQISSLNMYSSQISVLSVYVFTFGCLACMFCKLAGRS
ncbi:MAG: hypothetical protein KME47_19875 [Nodosilinea sp. WJT8-NPBG4]|nr:hypothetical protein [Nodosilinea sp. WJT8-NPBG4]